MPVRFIVIEIEWIKSAASRWCLWLIFQSTLETVRLSPTALGFFFFWNKFFGKVHFFHLSSLVPVNAQSYIFCPTKLLGSITSPRDVFSFPQLLLCCQNLFERFFFSCLSLFHACFLMTLLVIYEEVILNGKKNKTSKKKTTSYYSLF